MQKKIEVTVTQPPDVIKWIQEVLEEVLSLKSPRFLKCGDVVPLRHDSASQRRFLIGLRRGRPDAPAAVQLPT